MVIVWTRISIFFFILAGCAVHVSVYFIKEKKLCQEAINVKKLNLFYCFEEQPFATQIESKCVQKGLGVKYDLNEKNYTWIQLF